MYSFGNFVRANLSSPLGFKFTLNIKLLLDFYVIVVKYVCTYLKPEHIYINAIVILFKNE